MAKGRELEVHNSICEREDFKILIKTVAKRNGKLGRGGRLGIRCSSLVKESLESIAITDEC